MTRPLARRLDKAVTRPSVLSDLLPTSGSLVWTLAHAGHFCPTWISECGFLPRLFETRELARKFRRDLVSKHPVIGRQYRIFKAVVVRAPGAMR